MANTTLSPNMMMPVPNVGQDPGPDWANNLNACLSILDSHDHSPGKGNQITPLGLNINSDLSFIGNNATNLRSTRFTPQGAALSNPTDIGCLYEVGVDLYYNDGAGNQIRITQGGAVTGASGTITGLPSGTASASFSGVTFTFQSATNTPANIDGASFILRNLSANSKGLTLSAPTSLAANYQIFFPLLPAVKGIVTLNSSGNMNVEPAVSPVPATITSDSSGNLGTQPLFYDVTIGTGGTYSTWAAMNAAVTNDTVVAPMAQTFTENVVINKRIKVVGKGFGTIISGNLQFSSGCDDGTFDGVQITGTVTVDAAVNEIGITNIWVANSNSVTINSNSTGVELNGWSLT